MLCLAAMVLLPRNPRPWSNLTLSTPHQKSHLLQHPLLPPRLVDAVHAFLARTASLWTMVNPEDVFDLVEATNLPGTTVEHPNWSRRLPVPVEAWSGHPRWQAIAETQRERSTPGR
jgi:4-alpha-glucanotransferase